MSFYRFRRLLRAQMAGISLLFLLPAGSVAAESLASPIVFCQLPADQAPESPLGGGLLPSAYGEGATLKLLQPDGSVADLAPDFAGACDPDVSFDGQRILFAGQQEAGDSWNIFEIAVDATGLRQITHEDLDSRNPIYLSTLYTITSSEPWYTLLFVRYDGVANETATAAGTSLYSVRLDGSELRRITFHPGNDRAPFLMQDGYVLFAGLRLSPDTASNTSRVGLFGIQTDGIDYTFYGGAQGMRAQQMPTVTTEGLVVFVEGEAVDWAGAGRLGALDNSRPHHSYRPLTETSDGLFHSPSPLKGGAVLVSHRSQDTTQPFRLVRFSPGDRNLETVFEVPGQHILHGRAVAPRAEPDGRSSTVRPESPSGKLYGLDVYESDPAFVSLERGSVKRLRVIEGIPSGQPIAGSTGIGRRLLGEAPVEEDGSFQIDVPADLPVQLQLLDAEGLALATCDWIWVKPREYRGCIGCHEDPELTPPNRFVQAAARPATDLTLPAERRRVVGFKKQVLPVLSSRCLSCHESGPGLVLGSLTGSDGAREAYSALLEGDGSEDRQGGHYIEPGAARRSPLVWRLLGRDTSRAWDRGQRSAQEVPQDHLDLLSRDELRTLIEWVDLGAQWNPMEGSPPAAAEGASQ